MIIHKSKIAQWVTIRFVRLSVIYIWPDSDQELQSSMGSRHTLFQKYSLLQKKKEIFPLNSNPIAEFTLDTIPMQNFLPLFLGEKCDVIPWSPPQFLAGDEATREAVRRRN